MPTTKLVLIYDLRNYAFHAVIMEYEIIVILEEHSYSI
jgi:hypothetical protein